MLRASHFSRMKAEEDTDGQVSPVEIIKNSALAKLKWEVITYIFLILVQNKIRLGPNTAECCSNKITFPTM